MSEEIGSRRKVSVFQSMIQRCFIFVDEDNGRRAIDLMKGLRDEEWSRFQQSQPIPMGRLFISQLAKVTIDFRVVHLFEFEFVKTKPQGFSKAGEKILVHFVQRECPHVLAKLMHKC